MSLSVLNTLPPGMRERTFALVSGDKITKFGRGTDFPASSYTFPSVESNINAYQHNNHFTSFGNSELVSDFFEAQIGAVEPRAADKMDQLALRWNMPGLSSYNSAPIRRHELYYVLGGRPRLMYGHPSRLGLIHHGYKTSYHEAVLRFALASPFYYASDANIAKATTNLAANAAVHSTFIDVPNRTQVPTPASILLSGRASKVVIRDNLGILFSVSNLNGSFVIDNYPGQSSSRYTPTGGTAQTGADLINVETPPISRLSIHPDTDRITVQVTAGAAAANVQASVLWRDSYASP